MSYNKVSGVQDVLANTDVGGCMFTVRKGGEMSSGPPTYQGFKTTSLNV